MYHHLIQSSAFIITLTIAAGTLILLPLPYINVWAANNDPTQEMRITAGASGAPTTCISNCIIVNLPGPPHRTAHLIVINHVDNTAPGTGSSYGAPDFIMHVNGNNTSPTDFPGSESGVDVQLAAGPYGVTETKPITIGTVHQYSASYSSDCVGIINDGETKTCTVTNLKGSQA